MKTAIYTPPHAEPALTVQYNKELMKPLRYGSFSFDGDAFLAEAPGGHHHSRAEIDQLRSHFQHGLDRPKHWYQAQLIHYGKYSLVAKNVAKRRLENAVRRGKLCVPGHIRRIEKGLRKE